MGYRIREIKLMNKEINRLSMVFNILLGCAIMLVSFGIIFVGYNWYVDRPVAVDARVFDIDEHEEYTAFHMDWHNQRPCEFRKGSLKVAQGDLRDIGLEFLRLYAGKPIGPRGEGPQKTNNKWKIYRPKDVTGPNIIMRVAHTCGDRVVFSTMLNVPINTFFN